MKFVALYTGQGEGCDYTIACNRTFNVFEAVDVKAAVEKCKEQWSDYGGGSRIADIRLFVVGNEVIVPVDRWNADGEADKARREAEEELSEVEAKAAELRKRLGR